MALARDENLRRKLRELAREHGLPESAVETLHEALARTGGTMAQFSHPDLGGSGQWMSGGMVMVSDMFNHGLKAKVDAICRALAPLAAMTEQTSHDLPGMQLSTTQWWPGHFKSAPASTGTQNEYRYAYFPKENALVIQTGGKTTVYDTTGHTITGFGQQQSTVPGFHFHTRQGNIAVSSLPKKR